MNNPKSKRPFASIFENLTIHGIRHVFNENGSKFLKLFWSLALIISTIGFFVNSYRLFNKLQFKPDINVRNRHVFTSLTPFPAITICTPLFARPHLVDFITSLRSLRTGKPLDLTETQQNYLASNLHACNPVIGRLAKSYTSNRTNDDVVKLLNESSLEIDETFLTCVYNEMHNDCLYMLNRIITDHGFCYTFNQMGFETIFNEHTISSDFYSYKRSGIKQSLYAFDPFAFSDIDERNDASRWSLDKGYSPYHHGDTIPVTADKGKTAIFNIFLNESYVKNVCLGTGNLFTYYLHLPNEIMLPTHQEYSVEFDKKSDVVITAQSYSADESLRSYKPRARGCYFEGEKQLKFFNTYTKRLCEFECMTNYTLKSCGCVKFSMPRSNDTPVCTVDKAECYVKAMNSWPEREKVKDVFEATCECLKTCFDIKYEVKNERISTSENVVMVFDNKNLTQGDVLSRINFMFDDYQIVHTEEYSAYTINNFIADVGGLLGFFLGCSILSLIEIVYFLIQTCSSKLQSRLFGMQKASKKKKKSNKKTLNPMEWKNVNKVQFVKPHKKMQNGIFIVPRTYKDFRKNAF